MNDDRHPSLRSQEPSKPQFAKEVDRFDELYAGFEDSVSRTILAENVADFARLSGDYNALHTDDEFAARTGFGQRVVHGFLHASLLSTLVGMRIPGPGALYLSQSIDFTKPVFIGDTVTARGMIEKIDEATRILTIRMTITNQHEETVLKGVAQVKVLRLAPIKEEEAETMAPQLTDGLLKGKTALVTGASRGIGRAVAKIICAHGAHVYVNYHKSEQAASSLVDQLVEQGGRATKIRADVANEAEAARLVEEASAGPGLDILINNAGPRIASGAFETLKWADMEQAVAEIVGSVFHVTSAALPALKARKGCVVNILTSAVLGRTAHNWLPYVTAKSALLGMSKNLAQELGPSGVRVNMISPSMVDTDLTSDVPDRIRQMMVSRTPLRRLATAEDVAGAVLFLVSPYANFITGDNLLVTGGDIML